MDVSLSRAKAGLIRFAAGIVCMLMGIAMPIQAASAAEATGANPDAGKRFATVLRVRGEVVASGGSTGKERTLREGDAVYVGERVRARLAELLAAERPFRLTADQDARLEALLAEALTDQGARV